MRWLIVAALIGCGHNASMIDGNSGDGGDDSGIDAEMLPGDGPIAGDASIVPSCPSGTWCQEQPPPGISGILGGVFALDANHVWAVGDSGAILLRHQNAWAAETSNTTAALRTVWASSASDVWAGGTNGALVHYDGHVWTPVVRTTVDINGIWGTGPNDVWIVGPSVADHWNGSAWSIPGQPVPGGTLLSVTGTGASDVWVCGESASVRHYVGAGSWGSQIRPITGASTYYSITAGGGNVWVSTAGDTARLEGSTWVEYTPSTSPSFFAISIASANDVWAVGGTKVGNWTGTTWDVSQPAPVTQALYGVATAGTDVFVVGAGAMILHRD